jgi:YHS domain-containing protein
MEYTAKRETDPVCGMNVSEGKDAIAADYRGERYLFCAEACRGAFERDPERYMRGTTRKGWFGRFLDRLGRANAAQFGSAGPRCCH